VQRQVPRIDGPGVRVQVPWREPRGWPLNRRGGQARAAVVAARLDRQRSAASVQLGCGADDRDAATSGPPGEQRGEDLERDRGDDLAPGARSIASGGRRPRRRQLSDLGARRRRCELADSPSGAATSPNLVLDLSRYGDHGRQLAGLGRLARSRRSRVPARRPRHLAQRRANVGIANSRAEGSLQD
jgi:hypothetical protein